MNRLTDLRFGFVLVAVVEIVYAVIGLLPPSMLTEVTGWQINPDGQWVVKLLAVALASQAFVAWVLRHRPAPGRRRLSRVLPTGERDPGLGGVAYHSRRLRHHPGEGRGSRRDPDPLPDRAPAHHGNSRKPTS
jgi:hypothetical protein